MNIVMVEPGPQPPADDLLIRETNHRWSNDLQLVVGLLALQGRRARSAETRVALTDAMERVAILSRARTAMCRDQPQSLAAVLRHVCDALRIQAELRSIELRLEIDDDVHGLSERRITTLALVVNELATNAVKHAFQEASPGLVLIRIGRLDGRSIRVTVDDDGRPFAEPESPGGGLGIGLAERLMTSVGGLFIPPPPGTKRFELHMPLDDDE